MIRRILRASNWWIGLRRAQREGLIRSFSRWRAWKRILDSPPLRTPPPSPSAPVELHMMCYYFDYLTALWTLKSFYRAAQSALPLTIHVEGRPEPRMMARLRAHLPDARIVTAAEASHLVQPVLEKRGLRRLAADRLASPYMLKVVDCVLMTAAWNLLILDADVFFFARPDHLLPSKPAPVERDLFQRDLSTNYSLTPEQARADLGIDLAPQVNAGIMLLSREHADPARFDRYLHHPRLQGAAGWIDQTLFALSSSEQRRVGFLPPSYLISLQRGHYPDELIARHYAGPSRPMLTSEGIPRLIETGILEP